MKRLRYTDDDGRIWVTTVPDDAPDDHAEIGVPYGPPDLSEMNLPEELAIKLHNALVERDILTGDDFRRHRGTVLGAIKAALGAEIQQLEKLYLRA